MTDRKMGITYNEFKKAVDEIDVSDKIKRYFMDLICKAALTRLTEKERQEYRDHYFAVTIDDVIESAREEGLEEGMKEGMEKGIEKGMEKGIRQVAKSLLSQGISLESISKATGLSQEEISKLS
jgi:predicted transposase/invertase (TIGR01784 family)